MVFAGSFILLGVIGIYLITGLFSDEINESTDIMDERISGFLQQRLVKIIAEDIGLQGTGIVISPTGLILTNYHLLMTPAMQDGKLVKYISQQIMVRMPGGEILRPSVVAEAGFRIDPRSDAYDVILLKVPGTDLPYMEFESSTGLREEDELLFAGYLLNTNQIEIGSGRVTDLFSISSGGFNSPVAQVTNIDNGGLSGGPVFNRDLKAVGIMSMIDFAAVTEIQKSGENAEEEQFELRRSRQDYFGDMISQRSDVGFAYLSDPIIQYLKDLKAIK